MKIVIIEPLGISDEELELAINPLKEKDYDIVLFKTRTEDTEELVARGKDADIIIVANQSLSKNVLSQCKNLKMISVAFTGVDHIDINYCKDKGIAVSNSAGYSTHAVAELAFGLAISVLRNIPSCDTRCRIESTKEGLIGNELYGKTFGIIGTGSIGTKVAKISQAFGCKVIAYSRTEKQELQNLGIEYMSLDDVVAQSDILSLHIPFNEHTKGLLNEERINNMKSNAIVINTARGGVLDSRALADALNENRISGAGIDVFETEPPIQKDHPLLHSKNTVVTPHIAFASKEALFSRAEIVVENIIQWKENKQQNIIC